MLTVVRWEKELELMQYNFPKFAWFADPPNFGFQGYLRGRRSGRLYEVVLEADERFYPAHKPAVYLNPPVGPHWIRPDHYGWKNGRRDLPQLCVPGDIWIPKLDNFGSWLLRVIEYLEKHDA